MPFQFEDTRLPGVKIITPKLFHDSRGFFLETYKKSDFAAVGIDDDFVQDNHSRSAAGVIRGLHYQKNPHAQAKLVRVLVGKIYDVVVDMRQGSPTYAQWLAVELSAENRRMLYVPAGFAHGFAVLSEAAEIHYKASADYCREAESGVIWNDPDVGVVWPITAPLLSEKDLRLPPLRQADNNFVWSGN